MFKIVTSKNIEMVRQTTKDALCRGAQGILSACLLTHRFVQHSLYIAVFYERLNRKKDVLDISGFAVTILHYAGSDEWKYQLTDIFCVKDPTGSTAIQTFKALGKCLSIQVNSIHDSSCPLSILLKWAGMTLWSGYLGFTTVSFIIFWYNIGDMYDLKAVRDIKTESLLLCINTYHN